MNPCHAEYHSRDGKDSLVHSSHTLFCTLEKGHDGVHEFYGGTTSDVDCREGCDCQRCEDNHLGNTEELVCFVKEMTVQLIKHKKEKRPLRDIDFAEVKGILISSIVGRIKKIELSRNKEDRKKQCVHVANEIMMMWVKENETD